MTKDEKTLELVERAVAQLKNLPPPAGVSDGEASKKYYAVFDGPARWKPGVRTPEEAQAPAKKLNLGFKVREREKSLATNNLN